MTDTYSLAGYGLTEAGNRYRRFDVLVRDRKIIGKVQIISTEKEDVQENGRLILHVWTFATPDEKRKGVKAQTTYHVSIEELLDEPSGQFQNFKELEDGRYVMTYENISVVLKGNRVIVKSGEAALVSTLEALFGASKEDNLKPWKRARVKSNS